MCEGWSHFSCIGLKEASGGCVKEGFLCYFCVSTCLFALQIEVAGVKRNRVLLRLS